ncbi:hypothetical protein JHW15_004563, partial [Salmonella enterica subsp. enterica]|nr:hypothetical protein [Salmonella enterica subsp. enterica]
QGRYITQDPIGLKGGWNLYKYPFNPTLRIDPLGLFEDLSAFVNAPGVQSELSKAMFDNPWYTPNPVSISDSQGFNVTGKIDSIIPSISDAEYMGLEPVIRQEGLQDYIADMKFNVSGKLSVTLTCKVSDRERVLKEWKVGAMVPVDRMPVKVPLKEPSIPIPGMTTIIWVDRILNTGQFIERWNKELLLYGKELISSPDAICANSSY